MKFFTRVFMAMSDPRSRSKFVLSFVVIFFTNSNVSFTGCSFNFISSTSQRITCFCASSKTSSCCFSFKSSLYEVNRLLIDLAGNDISQERENEFFSHHDEGDHNDEIKSRDKEKSTCTTVNNGSKPPGKSET